MAEREITITGESYYFQGEKYENSHILYKYRDWNISFHHDIIVKNKVFFASPASFEDEQDCNVPQQIPSRDFLKDYYSKYVMETMPTLSEKETKVYVRKCMKQCPMLTKKKFRKALHITKHKFEQRFGVLSLTANGDNEDMWKKYSSNATGICIGFDRHKIEKIAGGGAGIIYCDQLPIITLLQEDAMQEHFRRVFFKLRKWRNEQEYRLHKMWKNEVSKEQRAIKLPENTIVEVRLGRNMPTENRREVIELCTKYQPQARIIEM